MCILSVVCENSSLCVKTLDFECAPNSNPPSPPAAPLSLVLPNVEPITFIDGSCFMPDANFLLDVPFRIFSRLYCLHSYALQTPRVPSPVLLGQRCVATDARHKEVSRNRKNNSANERYCVSQGDGFFMNGHGIDATLESFPSLFRSRSLNS